MRAAIWPAGRKAVAWGMVSLVALQAVACAGSRDAPKWLSGGEPHDYPEKRYVSGVGSGGDPDAAAASARAEVERKTQGEREGVTIAKTHVAKTSHEYWALAVLDRPRLLSRLTEEVGQLEQQISENILAVESATPEEALAPMLGAIALGQRRDSLLTRIAHLGGTPAESAVSLSRAALDLRLAAIKHALSIDVQAYEMDSQSGMAGSNLDGIRRALAQQVLAKGFALPAENDWGDRSGWLIARARIAFETLGLDRSHDFVAVRWEAVLELEEGAAAGKVVAMLTDESRATHLNEREARRQAQEQAEAFLTGALSSWLDEHLASRVAIQTKPAKRSEPGPLPADGDRPTDAGGARTEAVDSNAAPVHEKAPLDAETSAVEPKPPGPLAE